MGISEMDYKKIAYKILAIMFPFIVAPFMWVDITGMKGYSGTRYLLENRATFAMGILLLLTTMLFKKRVPKLIAMLLGNALIWIPLMTSAFTESLNKKYLTPYFFLFCLLAVVSTALQVRNSVKEN